MPNFIQEGDVVDIYYTNQVRRVKAKVLHVPCDSGDMWYFEHEGMTFAQNPQSSDLDTIRKHGDKKEEE